MSQICHPRTGLSRLQVSRHFIRYLLPTKVSWITFESLENFSTGRGIVLSEFVISQMLVEWLIFDLLIYKYYFISQSKPFFCQMLVQSMQWLSFDL